MAIDKELLKKLTVLYVEDDDKIRNELSTLLGGFVNKIYTGSDGRDGLEKYLANKDSIDVIISDINMPKLTGIEMMQQIRKVDQKVEILFATAYSDNEFLSEAIKLRVYDYIIKPIDIKHLLTKINQLAIDLHKESLIVQQNKDLERFKDIIDLNNIVIKTDTDGNITYVNDLFCNLMEYDKQELLGKPLNVLKHKDVADAIYDEMVNTIKSGSSWKGTLKNVTKSGDVIIVECYMIPVLNNSGELTGTISVNRDITKEVSFKRDLKVSMMKDKGKIFQDSKELSAELKAQIIAMQNRTVQLEEQVKSLVKEKKDMELNFEKDLAETESLRSELKLLQKKADDVEDKNVTTLKLSKQLADVKREYKMLQENNEQVIEAIKKEHTQEKVNLQTKFDEANEELTKLKKIVDEFGDIEEFEEKLSFWKEKAKNESEKVVKLEKELLKYTDKSIMKTILGEELNHSLKQGLGKFLK